METISSSSSSTSSSPEEQLQIIVSKIKWNLLRKDFIRRRRKVSSSYAHIYVSLERLIRVGKIVLKCYESYPKVYKRLGPATKNGGLESFLENVIGFKRLLEERFTRLLGKYFPVNFPVEIVKIILDFAVTGKEKIVAGNFSSFHSEEEFQQRKFLSLVTTLTLNLLNCILTSKMDFGGFSIEAQMDCCSKDLKAFTDLSEEGDEKCDFSKFSKLPSVKRRPCSRQIGKYYSSSSGRKISKRMMYKHDGDQAAYLL